MKARLPQGYGAGAPNNVNSIARQAQKMQEEMERVTNEIEAKEYTTSAGGNAVEVTLMGNNEIKSINIKPEVVDPEDLEMLSDMIVAAVNEGLRMVAAEKEERLGAITGGMSIPGLF